MKPSKNLILLSLIGLAISASPIFSFNKVETSPSEGVFIAEDNSEKGPMFYPAVYEDSISSETYYSTQKSYTFDSMNFSYTPTFYRGNTVKVAVIDSGLNYTHEDFINGGNQIIQGHSRTIDNKSGSWYYYQFDSSDQNQERIVDSLGHGTNVASVIASQINAIGCAGIAPNVELYVYKVTNDNNGYEWTAINSALSYCVEEGIDVINMSFQAYEHAVTYNGSTMGASTGCSSVMTSYINACYNHGITLVAAAGNYNTSEPSYPASNNHVISVGSLAKSSTTTKAGYSNTYGIDLVAPGSVYVADKGSNNAYKETQGTSFSAPIVTAAIALYKQQNPNATPSQIEQALKASCDSISGNPSWAGSGRLNIDRFLGVSSATPTSIDTNIEDDTLDMFLGDTYQLECSANPNTASQVIHYQTEDDDVITVTDDGLITAVGVGSALIEAYSGELSDITALIEVNVTSNPNAVDYIEVNTAPSNTSYIEKQHFDPTGLVLDIHYVNGNSGTVSYANDPSGFTFSPSTSTELTTSNTSVTITYGGKTVNQTISVRSKVLSSISISGQTTEFTEGDTFSFGGTVTAHYDNDENIDVTNSASFTGYNMSSTGEQTVTVSFGGKSTTYQITVNKAPVLENGHYEKVTSLSKKDDLILNDYYMLVSASKYNGSQYCYIPASATAINAGEFSSSGGAGIKFVSDPLTLTISDSGYKLSEVESKPHDKFSLSSYLNESLYLYCTNNKNGVTLGTDTPSTDSGKFHNIYFEDNKIAFKYNAVSRYISAYNISPYGFRSYPGTGTNGSAYLDLYHWVVDAAAPEVDSISIKTAPGKLNYVAGEHFDPTGLELTVTYVGGSSETIDYATNSASFSFSPSLETALTKSNTSVTITYAEHSVNQTINVKELSSISLSGQTTAFVEGDTFTFGGIVTANYSDESHVNVTNNATYTGYDMTLVGEQTVTVSYGGKSAQYTINVGQGTLDNIAVSGQTTEYEKNSAFSFDGVCTATFTNGYQKVVTPTSVSSPNMGITGEKTVEVSFTYNGKTKSTTYNINVTFNRVVQEIGYVIGYAEIGSITYPSNVETNTKTAVLSTSTSGYTIIENNSIRLGSNGNTGTITVTATSSIITKVVVSAKTYGSDSPVSLSIGGTSSTLTSSYTDYVKEYTTATNSVAISTKAKSKRANIQSIIVYETTDVPANVDISDSEDVQNLETFIDTYLHFADYSQSLGYCKDDVHHYYLTAKEAFNQLNDHQRELFVSNSAYVNEWARLSAWASANGDTLSVNTNKLEKTKNVFLTSITSDDSVIFIVILSAISLISITSFIYLKKKNEE